MANTWGDIIARNYSAGRAIGNDFSESRFSRRAQKLKDDYEARAAAEGKNLEDYLPELEQELEALAVDTGATRRAITTRGGETLDRSFRGRIYEDVGRGGERRAGALAAAGDQAGARDTRASYLYKRGDEGDFDSAQGQQIAGDTIRATSGALGADGTYDMAKGAQALAGVGARYGDAGQANAQQTGANTFRLQAARAKFDSVFNMVQNLDKFDNDQIVGAWEGFKQNVPEMANVNVRKGDDGKLYIFTGEKATGSFDPNDEADLEELAALGSQFTKDPGAALQGYMQAQLKAIEEQKAADTEFSGKIDDAMIDVVKGLKAIGVPDSLATKLSAAGTGGGESNGWQLQEIPEDPTTYMVQKGGETFVIRTNVPNPLDPAGPPVPFEVSKLDGTPVDPGVMDAADRAGISFAASAVGELLALGDARQIEMVKGQLRALSDMRASRLGGGSAAASSPGGGQRSGAIPRSVRNNNPGNIEDRGQFKGMPGYLGSDGRFARFDSPEAGQKAMESQLLRYMNGQTTGKPLRTVADIVGTWSPQADPTNQAGSTNNYTAYVARSLGVDPSQPLTPEQIPQLAAAMAQFEAGGYEGPALTASARAPAAAPAAAAAPARSAVAAASAAKPQTAIPRKATISPETVSEGAKTLTEAREVFLDRRAAYEKFLQDQRVGSDAYFGSKNEGAMPRFRPKFATPEARAVGERLEREMAQAEMRMQELTRDTRTRKLALQGQQRDSNQQSKEAALYSRYARGAADFFDAAQD